MSRGQEDTETWRQGDKVKRHCLSILPLSNFVRLETIARPSACWNPKGIGRNPSTCSGWKGAFGWKRALRAGTVGIPFILNHSIRRIHSSVKHSFPYEVSIPVRSTYFQIKSNFHAKHHYQRIK